MLESRGGPGVGSGHSYNSQRGINRNQYLEERNRIIAVADRHDLMDIVWVCDVPDLKAVVISKK